MKLKHITIVVSAIILLGFAGCKDMQTPVDTDTTTEGVIALNNAAEMDGVLATTQIVECSLEQGAFIPSDQTIFENSRIDRKDMGKNCPNKNRPMLGKVLRELNLTDAQLATLKDLNIAHRDCMQTAMTTWRDAVQPIIEKANADRKLIIDDLKNKVITRKQAFEKLKALNDTMKADIAALGLRDTIKAAIEDCNKTYLDAVKAMLTPEQLVIWEKYFPAE